MGGLSAAESGSLGSGEVSVAAARTGRPCCGRGGEASVKTCGGGAGATEAKCALSRDRGLEGASRPRQEESLVALEERSLGQAATGVASVVPAAAGRVSRWQREISTAAAVQKACRHLSQEEAAVLVEKAFFLRAKRGDLLRPRQEAAGHDHQLARLAVGREDFRGYVPGDLLPPWRTEDAHCGRNERIPQSWPRRGGLDRV